MGKIAVSFIILILSLSWFYAVQAANCLQNTSHHAGVYGTPGHKTRHHETCGLGHNHHMRHSDGRACSARIGCSHPDGSHSGSTLSDVDYSPARIEFACYYSILSYNRDAEMTAENEIPFPIERPPAL